MVEYGVKKLITNPTLITAADEIVKVIDARSKKTKAFVVPIKYEELMNKLIKEIEHQKWAKDKKVLLSKKSSTDIDKTLQNTGWKEIERYLDD